MNNLLKFKNDRIKRKVLLNNRIDSLSEYESKNQILQNIFFDETNKNFIWKDTDILPNNSNLWLDYAIEANLIKISFIFIKIDINFKIEIYTNINQINKHLQQNLFKSFTEILNKINNYFEYCDWFYIKNNSYLKLNDDDDFNVLKFNNLEQIKYNENEIYFNEICKKIFYIKYEKLN